MGQPFFTQPTAAVRAAGNQTTASTQVGPSGEAAVRRAAGSGGAGGAAQAEGWQGSDELDEEDDVSPTSASPSDDGSVSDASPDKAADEAQKAEEERRQLEEEQQRLEDQKKQLEARIDEVEEGLRMARRAGDKEAEAELTGQLAGLWEQRDAVDGRLAEVAQAIGALPPSGGGGAGSDGTTGGSGTLPVSPAAGGGGASPVGGGYPGGGSYPGGGGVSPTAGGGYPAAGAGYPGGGGAPAGAGGGIADGGGGGVPSASPVGPASQPVPGGPIGKGTKVLMIGDSHTIGAFGTELDKDLRSTGAQVSTYGSSGSSPSWWMDGHTTTSGYVARHADGSVEQPPWNQPHATPRLEALIASEKPDVLVVNLGANMRGASEAQIQKEVERIGKVAQESGTRLIWVGPPKQQSDMAGSASIDAFNAKMAKAVAPYGSYIDSSRYTRYAGSDGIHYGGTEGTNTARSWADRVFDDIQG